MFMKKFITIPAFVLSCLLFVSSAVGQGAVPVPALCEVFNASGEKVLVELGDLADTSRCPKCEIECYDGRRIDCDSDERCPEYARCGNYAIVLAGRVCPPEKCDSSSSSSTSSTGSCVNIGDVAKVTRTSGVGVSGNNNAYNSCFGSLGQLPAMTLTEFSKYKFEGGATGDYEAFSGVKAGLTARGTTNEYIDAMVTGNRLTRKQGDLIKKLATLEDGEALYLSKDCNWMTEKELKETVTFGMEPCVDYSMEVGFITPVSLVWSGKYEDVIPTVTSFPLSPKTKGKFVVWKGSATTPLIVYDPKKTGKITGPEALFGQYTFGKTWKDGFEALASLDKNGDGKLSGDELKDLSLWFDNDQNGVTEAGEVVDIREAGVVELYYGKSEDNTKDGSIIAVKGYRHKNGTEGPAVDWMSDAYDTQEEAQMMVIFSAKSASASQKTANFGGIWAWNVNSNHIRSQSSNTNGLFLLSQKDNDVKGRSIVELTFTDSESQIKSTVLSLLVNGTVARNSQLKFKVSNKGFVTETTAELSNDGMSMTGVSRGEALNKQTGKKETVHYTWIAKRIG